jgi:sugar phosphate isomerase/epimerase
MSDARSRLSLNIETTHSLTLEQAVRLAAEMGLEAVGLWRDRVQAVGLKKAARLVSDAGLRVSTLCRGGFLTASSPEGIRHGLDDNLRALDEAATMGAPELVMVVGGLPEGDRDLVGARLRVAERIAELAPEAVACGVRLGLEPLHPMYAADRAVLSTLEQALDLAAPHSPGAVGVVVDTFHIYWDPKAEAAIARAGREGRISSYQVCDFNLPIASDALLSRGMMGDGVIDFSHWTRTVTSAGYRGDVEVEIFNADIWERDPRDVVSQMVERYNSLVASFL